MLEKLGMSPERLKVDYISAAEGVKFQEVNKEMTAQLQALGKDKILAENAKLKPILERMLARKRTETPAAPAAVPATASTAKKS
jgi:hypothetical protein